MSKRDDTYETQKNSKAFEKYYEQNQLLLSDLKKQCYVINKGDCIVLSECKEKESMTSEESLEDTFCIGSIPSMGAEALGDRSFIDDYGTKYAYMAGAMANGISSVNMVIELGANGFLGSFGTGGLSQTQIEESICSIKSKIPNGPYAVNLLHSPTNVKREFDTVAVFLKHGVDIVEASAYINISPALVYYRLSGLKRTNDGEVQATHRVIAKISREEVALKFMQPADKEIVEMLLQEKMITEEQAALSKKIPMADDITVEADSAGHTDNRPLVSILPAIISLRDRIQQEYNYIKPVRIGAAGGISTPSAAIGAFQMGAAYIVTGSVNQACVEAGTSDYVRKVLAEAKMTDVMMAPCADMFELGAKVQVLKKGTMFPMNGQKLYEIYRKYSSLEELSSKEKEQLEKRIFKRSINEVWSDVVKYFDNIDKNVVIRAKSDNKHKMALIFRWYLGNSSRWAVKGITDRCMDMQIWCGQAMGAFNSWVKSTYMEEAHNRKVADVALHIMNGAAYIFRINIAELMGVRVPIELKSYRPDKPFCA